MKVFVVVVTTIIGTVKHIKVFRDCSDCIDFTDKLDTMLEDYVVWEGDVI